MTARRTAEMPSDEVDRRLDEAFGPETRLEALMQPAKTTEHKNLAEALAAVQAELPKVEKGAINPAYKAKYADLADISLKVLPVLGRHGLSFSAMPMLNEAGVFVLRYRLRHVGGDSDGGDYPLLQNGTPQQIGSALTYARRYTLCAVTGVAPADDDDDGQAAEQAAREKPRQQRRREEPPPDVMDDAQKRRMNEGFTALGHKSRDQRLAYTAKVLGMEDLVSSAQLTHDQADKVLAALEMDVAMQKVANELPVGEVVDSIDPMADDPNVVRR